MNTETKSAASSNILWAAVGALSVAVIGLGVLLYTKSQPVAPQPGAEQVAAPAAPAASAPAASVSGFYLAHPQSTYFNVGKIGADQLHDLARRRGVSEEALQRLLAPNL